MRARRSVTVVALAAATLCCTSCNRGRSEPLTAPVVSANVRPAQQQPQPSAAPNQTPVPATPPTQLPTAAETAPPGTPGKILASDRSENLTVAGRAYRLSIREQSIPGTSEITVECWELRDADDHVVYRETYPVTVQNGGFASTVSINGSSFTGRGGSGILISGMDLPSAPDSGGWVQVFAFKYGHDKYGADPSLFGPFGPPVLVEGEFLGVETDSYLPTPVAFGTATQTVMNDVLKFRVWTGNFNIVYPVRINWISGRLEPAWRCIETTSKGRVERCSYPVSAESHRENEPTFVRLFPEPDDGFTAKHLIVQPQTKVEFLEARVPVVWSEDAKSITFHVNGDIWLKVRIDGVEGWIHSEEDLQAVGLPQSG